MYSFFVTAAETHVVRFPSNKTKNHAEGGKYYVDKVLLLNCLHIALILTLNMLSYGQADGDYSR